MSRPHRTTIVGTILPFLFAGGCGDFIRSDVPTPPDMVKPDTRIAADAPPDAKTTAATIPDPPSPPASDYAALPLPPAPMPAPMPAPPPADKDVQGPFALVSGTRSANALPPPPVPESPLVCALRCAVEKNPDEAKRLLERYGKDERELLMRLMRLSAGLSESSLDKMPPNELTATLEQLQALTLALRSRATLGLERTAFCRKVEGFGRIEPVAGSHEFRGGCDGKPGEWVQLYTEVRHFATKSVAGEFETKLECSVDICDDKRVRVASVNLGTSSERSRAAVQDCFLNLQFPVPADLKPGSYTLWLTVCDKAGTCAAGKERVAKASVDFRVGAAK